eukprot:547515-Amphidinium_carterae.1
MEGSSGEPLLACCLNKRVCNTQRPEECRSHRRREGALDSWLEDPEVFWTWWHKAGRWSVTVLPTWRGNL